MGTSRARRANLGLLLVVPLAVISGLIVQLVGGDLALDPRLVHGVLGFAVIALTPWKSIVVRRGLAKRTGHGVSIALLTVVLASLATGLAHTFGWFNSVGPVGLMQLHVLSGVALIPLLWLHYRRHPVPVRRTDLGRRGAIRLGLLSLSGLAGWLVWEAGLKLTGAPGGNRRFTGSHEVGSFQPAAFPVTSWLDDRPPRVEAGDWQLKAGDERYTYDMLAGLGLVTVEATLDCTGGWHSRQVWGAVPMDALIDEEQGISFEVRSLTGYSRRFPMTDLSSTFLALTVGGEPLSAGHGYPARVVVPDRRGFWWVKWVSEITPSSAPAWLQSPFPLT